MPDEKPRRERTVGSGRKPGVPNKATGTVKDAFQQAFDLLDGPEGLARWAGQKLKIKGKTVYPNLGAFYELAAKLIPSESRVSGTTDHRHYVAREIAVERREALPNQAASSPRLGGIDPTPVDVEVMASGAAPLNREPVTPDNGAPDNWL